MKVIFSRKGLDSSFGSTSSVIFPNGTLAWLPIPETDQRKKLYSYNDLYVEDNCLGDIVENISQGKLSRQTTVHLDPDIFPFHTKRDKEWFPIFGQTGAAESHLRNCDVGPGDIFLFFSWFRKIDYVDGRYRYVSKTSNQHILYGWFQIEKKEKVNSYTPPYSWMKNHSHLQGIEYNQELDTVYFPTRNLILNGKDTKLAGCGYFPKVHDKLILTEKGEKRSVWRLPRWFFPGEDKKPLTYHRNLSRWKLNDEAVILETVGRGQEFVLDTVEYPQCIPWLKSLMANYGESSF